MFNHIAGPIFTEWYWTPIFFTILYFKVAFLYILVFTFFTYLLLILFFKARKRQFSPKKHVGIMLLTLTSVTLLGVPVFLLLSVGENTPVIETQQELLMTEKESIQDYNLAQTKLITEYCDAPTEAMEIQKDNVKYLGYGRLKDSIFVEVVKPINDEQTFTLDLNICPGTTFTKSGQAISQSDLRKGDILTPYSFTKNVFWANRIVVN